MTNKEKSYEDSFAATFLFKYFTVLIKAPDTIKNFYSPQSIISRRYGGGNDCRVTGFENLVETQKFANVNLISIDSQLTPNEGVFISCSGMTVIGDEGPRNFVQSFLLEKIESSYFITNDIFVLQSPAFTVTEQEQPDEASSHVEEHHQPHMNGTATTEKPVVDEVHVSKEPETKPSESTVNDKPTESPVVEVKPPQQQETKVVAVAAAAAEPPVTKPVTAEQPEVSKPVAQETTTTTPPTKQQNQKKENNNSKQQANTPAQPAKVQTMADLIKSTNTTPSTPTASNATTPTTTTTTTTATTTTSPVVVPATATVAATTATSPTPVPSKKEEPFTKEGCTIYFKFTLKTQTQKIEQDDIREALQPFGTIQHIKIFDAYGFVEFDKVESVQRLLSQTSKIVVNGINVSIEERKGPPPQKYTKSSKNYTNNSNNNNNGQFKDKRSSQNTNNNMNQNNNQNNKFQNNSNNRKNNQNDKKN